MRISTEILYNSVRANCFPYSPDGREYPSFTHTPFMSATVMRILMSSAGYSDKEIKLETMVGDFHWERITQEIDDLIMDTNEDLKIKLKLCKNYLLLNHSIKLTINL